MYNEEPRQVSEFNENALKIQRLHNLYLDIARYRHNGDLIRERWILETLEAELKFNAKRLDSNDNTNYLATLKEINSELSTTKNLYAMHILLIKKEELLREVQQEIGMGTTYKDPSEDDMD